MGALPIVNTFDGIKQLNRAIEYRLNKNNPIVIYPETHVWEYYKDIRPFHDTSFKFPIKFNKPAFAMTVTHKKSKILKKPVMEVFLDGPFYPNGNTPKEKIASLHSSIYETMKQRSESSNANYIQYKKIKAYQ